MTAIAAHLRLSGRSTWTSAGRLLLGVALATLLYVVARIGVAAYDGRFLLGGVDQRLWPFALTAVVYMTSHAFRILRLALLIGGWRFGFRDIASFHLMTAALSLTAPLKLGEIYRVVEMSNIAGGVVRAIVITWMERLFDAVTIFLVLALALRNASGEAFGAVTALTGVFILATAVAFVAVPDNLRRLSFFIIQRHDEPQSVPLLRTIDMVRRTVMEAPSILRNRIATLAILSVLIWACEIACFALMFPALSHSLDAMGAALLAFLSAVTRGEMLLGVLDAGTGAAAILPYLAATQAPLALTGALVSIHYARLRFRS